jgi:fatty acid CoA ligase FadD9
LQSCGTDGVGSQDIVDEATKITLVLVPDVTSSQLLHRSIMSLFGALGSGGTAYFAAKSDLPTLLEDLALVHPTDSNTGGQTTIQQG